MTTLDVYSEPLEKAIEKMRSQMAQPANVAKDNWRDETPAFLYERLNVNLRHLHKAALTNSADDALRFAANIANFAWMIADQVEQSANAAKE